MSDLILPPRQAVTIADQGPALAVLLALFQQHPDLPPAVHIYLFDHVTTEPQFRVSGPAEFEAWRTALGVPPADVTFLTGEHVAFLSMVRNVRGFRVQINGSVADSANNGRLSLSPQDDARLQAGRLDEQKHQFLDVDLPALVTA